MEILLLEAWSKKLFSERLVLAHQFVSPRRIDALVLIALNCPDTCIPSATTQQGKGDYGGVASRPVEDHRGDVQLLAAIPSANTPIEA